VPAAEHIADVAAPVVAVEGDRLATPTSSPVALMTMP